MGPDFVIQRNGNFFLDVHFLIYQPACLFVLEYVQRHSQSCSPAYTPDSRHKLSPSLHGWGSYHEPDCLDCTSLGPRSNEHKGVSPNNHQSCTKSSNMIPHDDRKCKVQSYETIEGKYLPYKTRFLCYYMENVSDEDHIQMAW